jgi:magnesium-protoporphyrin IX monomethyl ester (oxidative) cyclase
MDCMADGFESDEKVSAQKVRYGLSFHEIREWIESWRPDVVGVTCLFSTQFDNALNVCRQVKEFDLGCKTVIGGHHATAMAKEVLQEPEIDYVLAGEAEKTILPLLQAVGRAEIPAKVSGAGFKQNGQLLINSSRGNEEDLDALPFPSWELFPLEKYFTINRAHGGMKESPFFPVLTSRGCPFDCSFCGSHVVGGKKYRYRSAQNVIDEIKYLKDRFGAREIFFEDDNLTLNKNRAMDIFGKMVDEKLDIRWSPPNGLYINSLDDEMLELMKESGCHSISLAVESADPYVQKEIIRKQCDLKKVNSLLKRAKEIGLSASVFLIVGFPGEEWSRIKRTLKYAIKLKCDSVNIFFATPLPGSDLLETCRKKGLIDDSSSFDIEDGLCFSHDMVSNKKIQKAVYLTRFIIKFKLLFINPIEFIRKSMQKIFNDPEYFVKQTKKLLSSLGLARKT